MWSSSTLVPFKDVAGIGFSDMEFYYDEVGTKVVGQYYFLRDNGFGTSDNSADYPLNIQHLKLQKPFTYRHGEPTFEKYTEAINMVGNGAEIQVTYKIPDSIWDDWKELRVLTGHDFDVEGLALLDQTCAIVGEELMPALFTVNPKTGVVLSPFVSLDQSIWARGRRSP